MSLSTAVGCSRTTNVQEGHMTNKAFELRLIWHLLRMEDDEATKAALRSLLVAGMFGDTITYLCVQEVLADNIRGMYPPPEAQARQP